jgi:hypothetical protein
MPDDSVLDDLFPACALAAFLEQARAEQGWPDMEATRIRAYQLYEAALAEKNRRKQPAGDGRTSRREAGPGCEAPEGDGGSATPLGMEKIKRLARIKR